MPARTSLSHPLEIAELPLAGGGCVGVTFCPGKQDPHSISGPWDRDLELDVARIRDWGAELVLTLVETHEFELLAVPHLPATMRAQPFEWHHLPIRDVGIPAPPFEERWCYSGQRARTRLARGGKVLVHCRGGLGRAGTIAARLLVECGEAPARAIARVRAARPGAIETLAQERYAAGHRDVRAGDAHASRVLGCVLGGAVGDAFGYEVEFDSLATIRRRHGPAGLTVPAGAGGPLVVSDDTQMTLFTLEGLLAALPALAAGDLEATTARVRLACLDWLATQGGGAGPDAHGTLAFEAVLNVCRAPGTTCLSALRAGGQGHPGAPLNDSKGCGGVMRTAPCGLFPHLVDARAAFALGARAAALTHGHPSGYLSAGAMAAIVRELTAAATAATGQVAMSDRSAALRAAARSAAVLAREWPRHGETVAAMEAALARAAAPAADPSTDVAALGAGWVGEEALAIGLYAALRGADFAAVLAIAANHDGDSDSTASIAGQLWGAAHGVDDIPHAWIDRLDVLAPALGLLARTLAAAPHDRRRGQR